MEKTPQSALKSVAYDLSDWHNDPACEVRFVQGGGGIGVKIVCETCHCLCDVEATGRKILVTQSYLPHHAKEVPVP
jgi:hypothetical protein